MRSKTSWAVLRTVGLLLGMGVGMLAASSAQAQTGVPRPDHVVIVIEENHSYSEIIGNAAAPYINSLAQQGASFTASSAITHPSEPNYLAFFSGSTQGVTDDSCPHTFTAPNLASELIAVGLTFGGYSEDMPSVGYMGCQFQQYWRKHNPWVNWQGVNVPSAANMPFTSFPSNFTALPTVAIVVPNQNNDMHDGTIPQADTWLQTHLDAYVQWAKTNNSLLIVTWDEDDSSSSNRIPTLFVGPMVNRGQYSETINHYNVLRTLEDMYGLPYAGNSATATPITDAWVSSLQAPSALNAAAVSRSQINLAWTDNSANEDGFKIERSTDGTNFTPVATVGMNVTAYMDTELSRNKTYYYRVRAFLGTSNSAYSNTASARTLHK